MATENECVLIVVQYFQLSQNFAEIHHYIRNVLLLNFIQQATLP